jgi:transaldolase/transaldolase/glucose-6-phosphate isomerase
LLNKLASVGIDLDAITQQLEDEGVEKFVSAFERLMSSIRKKQAAVHTMGS